MLAKSSTRPVLLVQYENIKRNRTKEVQESGAGECRGREGDKIFIILSI